MSSIPVCTKKAAGVPISGSPCAADVGPIPGRPSYNVAIIGCGASGIVAMKEFLENGHKVTCFEANESLGGVFGKSRRYENNLMTSSSLITAFSDFTWGDDPTDLQYNFNFDQYCNYLDCYMKFHKLYQFVKFNTYVMDVRKTEEGHWELTTKANDVDNVWNLEMTNKDGDAGAKIVAHKFDRVVMCSGIHQRPITPHYPGMDTFPGDKIHLMGFDDKQKLKGKRVVCIGAGEAGSDLSLLCAKVASKCYLSIRGVSGFVVPRWTMMDEEGGKHPDAVSTDTDTGRALHMNARYDHPIWKIMTRLFIRLGKAIGQDIAVLTDEHNLMQRQKGANWWNNYGTKNASMHTAVHLHGLVMKPGIEKINGSTIIFDDGTKVEADVIVLGTGWAPRFRCLERYHPDIAKEAVAGHPLFRKTFTTKYREELTFLGLARPAFGAMPPLADIQSRWAAFVVSGIVKLPTKEHMSSVAKRDERRIKKQFNLKPNPLTVDFLRFNSGIAHEMGVRPNLVKLFFTDFKLWWHLIMGPITGPSWRLVGPGARPEYAREVLVRSPTADFSPIFFLIQLYTSSCYLLGYKTLGIKHFKPYRPSTLFQEN